MRSRRVEIRLNDREFEELNSRRGALRLRTFVRVASLGNPPARIPEINRTALAELQRIGGNLNQIARHLNTTGASAEASDLNSLREQVSQLRATLAGATK